MAKEVHLLMCMILRYIICRIDLKFFVYLVYTKLWFGICCPGFRNGVEYSLIFQKQNYLRRPISKTVIKRKILRRFVFITVMDSNGGIYNGSKITVVKTFFFDGFFNRRRNLLQRRYLRRTETVVDYKK